MDDFCDVVKCKNSGDVYLKVSNGSEIEKWLCYLHWVEHCNNKQLSYKKNEKQLKFKVFK